jgi:putative DNA primase/helicase
MQFLDELWGGDRETNDAETILALQLVFAYLLSGYTREQKIIFLVGIRRSGKGTIARLLTALFGRDMVCNPTFQSIGERFGGENLIGKSIAIIGDARLSGRTDIQTCVERLLSISGEDHQSVQRKNKPDWNGRLNVRFLILSNEVPQLTDASATIASRMVALRFKKSFYGHEDKNLDEALLTELPGILNWTLDGFDAMRKIGLIQPYSALEDIRQMEELASPIRAFVEECTGFDSGRFWFCQDAFERWKWFCEDTNYRPGTIATFGKNLRAAFPKIDREKRHNDKKGKREWAYIGIYPVP